MSSTHGTQALLQCRGISKSYGKNQVLKSIDLEVFPREFVALLGPSGCGKTTLLRILAGFEPFQGGTLHFENQLLADTKTMIPPERRNIGMVFQDYALFPHLSVQRNIAFSLQGSKQEKQYRVDEMLNLVGLLEYAKYMPYELSGGQQQRVAVARALAPRPSLILMDEPFSNLDTNLRTQLRNDIRKILREEEVSAILVTHDQGESFSFADRLVVMNQGQVEHTGTAEEVYHQPQTPWVASFTGSANFLEGKSCDGKVQSVLGDFACPNLKNGQDYQLLIRPERLSLDLVDHAQSDGEIEHIEFLGDRRVLTIRLWSGEKLTAVVSSAEEWMEKTWVKVSSDQVVPFPVH
ncbi:MAG: hypothetical protein COB67_09120 [SAR324 cluster bacterium]|uniref:ABC transporter domain-containing protein n=1 Tax=SAR324 cluster bacterium TaxID=2024889 RepID=A0A2A4T0S0_9DELT|nr:MAG: hypothetical protein COB67_09120 [SAR324 cluster bacterium]